MDKRLKCPVGRFIISEFHVSIGKIDFWWWRKLVLMLYCKCSMEFTRTISWSIWLWRRSWGDWIYIACWWLGLYRIVYTFYSVLDHIFVRNGTWVDFLLGYLEFQTWLYGVNIIDIQRPRFAVREAIHETTDSRSNESAKLWYSHYCCSSGKWIWNVL